MHTQLHIYTNISKYSSTLYMSRYTNMHMIIEELSHLSDIEGTYNLPHLSDRRIMPYPTER